MKRPEPPPNRRDLYDAGPVLGSLGLVVLFVAVILFLK